MSVADNIGYGLKVRRVPAEERKARVAELLDMVGLTELARRRIDRISGGQRQRVALARALAIRPRVLLLDEPLAALDASLRERLRVEIASLLRTFRITAVYVTHDQAEAMAIGDRVAVMNQGRIVQIGTPEAIYQKPASRFAAEFVGVMNRVSGPVRNGCLQINGGSLPVSGPDRDAVLWFRPEAVNIAAQGLLQGTITGTTFLGATRRIEVDVGSASPILVDAPAVPTVRVGEPISLSVAPEALLELPDEAV
jgi:putative spermidine/putrescine transport system ATP-binding protein